MAKSRDIGPDSARRGRGPTRPDAGGEDFAALFEASERATHEHAGAARLKAGDLVSGPVVSISAEAVFVDLGGKSEGVLSIDQVTDRDGQLTVAVGDVVEARVVDAGERSGAVELKRTLGKGPDANSELVLAYEQQIPVEGRVVAVNKGGFDVQVAGTRAFCPVSQIDDRFVESPEEFVGRQLRFRITRYEPGGRGGGNLVVSRRALLEEEAAARAARTREHLEVGAVLGGSVTRIEKYGAFVDLGGIEGMVHVSELGYARIDHPSELLSIGQRLEVQVLSIEPTGDPRRPEKISLSIKALARDPWEDAPATFPPGTRVAGTVRRIEQYGAFVEIAPGVEGLVHISEMGAGERLSSARKAVSLGQTVEVTVLSVDPEQRRISLSMDAAERAAQAADEREALATYGQDKASLGTFADLLKDLKPKR